MVCSGKSLLDSFQKLLRESGFWEWLGLQAMLYTGGMNIRLIRKFTEAGNAVSFIFETDEPIAWEPGQYMTITIPDMPPVNNERTFTISAAPYEKHLQITTRITESKFKQRLDQLEVNEVIEADQFGGDFLWEDRRESLVFVAGGIGITPFHSMLKQRHHDNKPLNATLLYATRDQDIPFKAELDKLQLVHPELHIHYVVGEHLNAENMQSFVPKLKESYVYLSGPEPMVDAFEEMLTGIGMSKDQLKQDWFPGYTDKSY
jgi:ferredoxin-NADP reductase